MSPNASKLVWITGASSGLGAALAKTCVADGHRVVISARSRDKLAALRAELGAPEKVYICPMDVTVHTELVSGIDQIISQYGLPDLTILNAGTYTPMGFNDFSADKMRELFELNVFAIAEAIELLIPRLGARGEGTVAVVGSVAGDIGLPYAGAYAASKSALMRLCESLRPEFERAGLQLSIVNPGFIKTPLTAKNDFPMPFMISAERAAKITMAALERGRFEIRYPFLMSIAMRVLTALPRPVQHFVTTRMLRE